MCPGWICKDDFGRRIRSLTIWRGEQLLQVVRPKVLQLQHARSRSSLLLWLELDSMPIMAMATRRHHLLFLAAGRLLVPVQALTDAVAPLQRQRRRVPLAGGVTADPQRAQRLQHVLDGEVEHRGRAAHGVGGLVVGERGSLRGVEGTDPHALAIARRVPYLRCEPAPWPPPHPNQWRVGRRLLLVAEAAGARPVDGAGLHRRRRRRCRRWRRRGVCSWCVGGDAGRSHESADLFHVHHARAISW